MHATSVSQAAMAERPDPLRPLRVASHLAPSVLPAYAFAARRMSERLGRPAELLVAADYGRCAADVDDVCFVCSIPYLLLSGTGRIGMEVLAAPILRGARYADRPVYFSDVIVHAESPYRSFADLEGARWAFNEPYSHSGFVVALHHLAEEGLPRSFIGEWIEAGYHDEAIRLVLDRRADWAAIDSQVLQLWYRRLPSLRRRLRTLAVLGPSTIQPVVASTARLDRNERAVIRDCLLEMDADPQGRLMLGSAGIRRWTPMTDGDYADIRRMLGRVRSAGLLPNWWADRWDAVSGISPRSPERAQLPPDPPPPARRAVPPHRPGHPRRSAPRPSRSRS